jgi:YD repeat-containing protein
MSANPIVFPVDGNKTKECDENTGCSTCSGKGMATYWLHLMLASLHIEDTPISYNCPRGPAPDVKIVYNQREANQPTTFTYSNFGPRWTFNWLSYVNDDTNDTFHRNPSLYLRGGGTEVYDGYDPHTGTYAPEKQTAAVLVRNPDGSYQRSFPDDSKEIFSLSDGASPRHVFLTRVVDAHGNEVDLTYDSSFRLTTITDSVGQNTTISYVSSDPGVDFYLIDHITDPFGRVAQFEYEGDGGQLSKITDPVGIESEFFYDPGTNFINRMRTPYGDTLFTHEQAGNP